MADAVATPTVDPVVVSAMRLTNGDLRVVVVASDGTFSMVDAHVVDATKLPAIELPMGRAVKTFVQGGGQIGVDTTPVPDLPSYLPPRLPTDGTVDPAAGTTSGDAIIDALSPAQAAKADVRDIVRLKGVPDMATVKSKLRRIAEANGTTPDALIATAKSGG